MQYARAVDTDVALEIDGPLFLLAPGEPNLAATRLLT